MSMVSVQARAEERPLGRRGERGYTLVALLALMSIIILMLITAAPSARHQMQRTQEQEAIWRGEQVAEAIRQYTVLSGRLPTSIDQLLEGVPRGTKRIQILRPVAAIDPLSSTGEWRLVQRSDQEFLDFQRAVTAYAGGPVRTRDTNFVQRAGGEPAPLVNVLNTGLSDDCSSGSGESSASSSGPFIGVASRSSRKSIITYYGIECHDKWVFTPFFR